MENFTKYINIQIIICTIILFFASCQKPYLSEKEVEQAIKEDRMQSHQSPFPYIETVKLDTNNVVKLNDSNNWIIKLEQQKFLTFRTVSAASMWEFYQIHFLPASKPFIQKVNSSFNQNVEIRIGETDFFKVDKMIISSRDSSIALVTYYTHIINATPFIVLPGIKLKTKEEKLLKKGKLGWKVDSNLFQSKDLYFKNF